MSMADDDVQQAAIDTSDGGESYTPPAQAPAPAEAAPQAGPTPAPQASAGIPNVGPAPVGQGAASTPMGGGGFNPAGPGMQQLGSQVASDVGQGVENFKKSMPGRAGAQIIAYLMGKDASHPEMLDQAAQQVDPQGQMTEADRNLLAIDHAHSIGGVAASWPLLQANRVAYNGKGAFAKVALDGTQQKPADLNAAIDAANKAQANVPDGSNIKFAPSQGGVTATVTMPGTSQVQRINLTPQQFSQFLDVGNGGQWDKLMEHGAPAVLQKIASSGGATKLGQLQPQPKPAAEPPAPEQENYEQMQRRAPDSQAVRTGQPQARDVTQGDQPAIPGTHDVHGHYIGPAQDDNSNYGSELEARSRKIFPSVGQEAERNAWMAAQEQESSKLENAVEVAKEKGVWADKRAATTGGLRNEGETIKAGAKTEAASIYSGGKLAAVRLQVDAKNAAAGNKEARDRIDAARKNIAVKRQTAEGLTPEDKVLDAQLTQAALQAGLPKLQAPQAPAQQQAPQQQAAPQRSAQDQQAAAWAKANPNDPRAKAIMTRLGAQ